MFSLPPSLGDGCASKLATVATAIANADGRKKIPTERLAIAQNPRSRITVIPSRNDRMPLPAPNVRTIG